MVARPQSAGVAKVTQTELLLKVVGFPSDLCLILCRVKPAIKTA